jgi:LysM repeat protein
MNSATMLPDPYRVKAGETLSTIAKRSGQTIGALMKYNGIKNPNYLEVGQTLFLSQSSAFGVSTLFLDALRHPIANLKYQLRFDGQVIDGTTDATGMALRQITKDATSHLQVWVSNAEQQWQQIASVASGYGHRLLTLVSNSIVIKGKTELHPHGAPQE